MRFETNHRSPHSAAWNRLAACFLFTAVLSGCGSSDEVGPDVVAVIGDVDIAADRLAQAIDRLHPGAEGRQARLSEEVARRVLGQLISIELMVRAAENRNLDRDPKVQGQVEQRQRELLLEELFHRGIVKVSANVTSAEARTYFDEHHIGEQRRVRRILVDTPQAATLAITRLRGDETFAAVARELSQDPQTSAQGGDLGWLSRLDFRNYILRRQVFSAQVGQLVGPVQEPDGYSVLTVEAVHQVSFEEVEQKVRDAVEQEKRSVATFRFLEDLANDADVRLDHDAAAILFGRLRDSGVQAPQLGRGEAGMVLLKHGDQTWGIGDFLEAVTARKDPVEIVDIEGLHRYARRLFAYYALLPLRATDLGLDDTERVREGVRKVRREALLERLREVEVTELIEISEEDLRQYYERNLAIYVRSDRISILEVLVDDREQADDLIRQLENGGDLEQLASRYSMRSSRVRRAGGRMKLMRPDKYGRVGFEASEAEVGEIVGPIRSSQGFSVFRVLRKIPGYQSSFEEARYRAGWHMKQDLAVENFDRYVNSLRERSGAYLIVEDNLKAFLAGRLGAS